jgi:hypothetical protein
VIVFTGDQLHQFGATVKSFGNHLSLSYQICNNLEQKSIVLETEMISEMLNFHFELTKPITGEVFIICIIQYSSKYVLNIEKIH